ncbi:MAG: Asp-tRNA(Asn)/Glu-tRNA(Gln) amidotransferase subunit GatA [Verrucomicrobiales bacterium]|nr:Asp-tRNA(Asn)/Glu-tRNA(Gln) amidotransferase subunit GatA [Verrucomicrobiales bacterium]MBP9223512.1 Asp-tRNA(Asn)/Glu-tRNA(Gln) amidotransferase subunit GatA [Verrucomicrobiales bacterium]
MNVASLTISQLREAYLDGTLTPAEALSSLAGVIDQKDPAIGGYLSYDLDLALSDATSVDLKKPLGGIPIAIKDLINVAGHPCSCASKILDGKYTAPYDATVVRKLREAGAIPFGRTNMDEFAMGSSNENSGIKPCRNPHDLERIPGGSSGGSAAVIAANTAIAALGTDTGGSIRQPASHCGIVGLKPTYGRVSRYGLVAFASSLDQCGPMTKTVADAALLLEVISGSCDRDSTCLDEEVPRYTEAIGKDIKGLRIGLPTEYFAEGLASGVRTQVESAIRNLESLGAEIVPVSLPNTSYAVATYYIIATAEASANLARFDGVRYGHRAEADDLIELYKKSRAEGFGEEVKRRIILGTYVLSSGYYDAYYLRAQKVRTLIRRDFEEAFAKVDLIASPVSPTPAFKLGEHHSDPLSMYLADLYTISANLAGVCGISVPCGTVTVDGSALPVGLQLLGKPMGEMDLIRASHAHEVSFS